MNVLDPKKVEALQEKLSSAGKTDGKINLEDYDLDPAIPVHYYEKAKQVEVQGAQRLVYVYKRTHVIEAPLSKLSDEIEGLENGPEQWKLQILQPVAKRPNKTTGAATYMALLRKDEPVILPMTLKAAPIEGEAVADLEVEAKKAKGWESGLTGND